MKPSTFNKKKIDTNQQPIDTAHPESPSNFQETRSISIVSHTFWPKAYNRQTWHTHTPHTRIDTYTRAVADDEHNRGVIIARCVRTSCRQTTHTPLSARVCVCVCVHMYLCVCRLCVCVCVFRMINKTFALTRESLSLYSGIALRLKLYRISFVSDRLSFWLMVYFYFFGN